MGVGGRSQQASSDTLDRARTNASGHVYGSPAEPLQPERSCASTEKKNAGQIYDDLTAGRRVGGAAGG